jgi:membrane protease subunit (stomatin/prohibitin family)
MPWFDKALKSVQDTAGKAAFEADKLVRANRETSVLSELQHKAQGKLVDLGQAALALYRSGALTDPTVAGLAAELAELEAQVEQQKGAIEAIRNEQYQPAGQTTPVAAAPAPAAAAPAPVETATRVEPSVPETSAAPELTECPNCHKSVEATATFCPECGQRLK